MADLEVGGLHGTSSIKDAARYVGFYTGVLGKGLLYGSVPFDDPSIHQLALANGASTGAARKGRPKIREGGSK